MGDIITAVRAGLPSPKGNENGGLTAGIGDLPCGIGDLPCPSRALPAEGGQATRGVPGSRHEIPSMDFLQQESRGLGLLAGRMEQAQTGSFSPGSTLGNLPL